jgi:hypothetical protein
MIIVFFAYDPILSREVSLALTDTIVPSISFTSIFEITVDA